VNNLKYNPFDGKTYKARNKNNIFSLEQAAQNEAPPLPPEQEVGYLSVSVFTASGALPVEGALVTVYVLDESGTENEVVHHVSDANGKVPLITLPVIYNRFDPFESSQYYFTTYNLRVQAINYYTVNVLDLRIFPNTTTYFQIDMIPAAIGPRDGTDTTIVIPPSPIDISND
jgi:hypothetical protein